MSVVRGWCPSAHRPMMSGDGLLVRVRPPMARLTTAQCRKLANLSLHFTAGLIDLTSRGNLQLRGARPYDHEALLAALIEDGFVEDDPVNEVPLTVTPFPDAAGETARLVKQLRKAGPVLPALPPKLGIVVDTGDRSCLHDVSGDFRFERGEGGLILRADGLDKGCRVTVDTAVHVLVELAEWYVRSGGAENGRMRSHVAVSHVPEEFRRIKPVPDTMKFAGPDLHAGTVGLAFGRVSAEALRDLCAIPDVTQMVFTPWRAIILTDISGAPVDLGKVTTDISGQNAPALDHDALLTEISDPIGQIDACPGAPSCSQATVGTHALARALARLNPGAVHLSGCDKGCARREPCAVTLVGRGGTFDLVEGGRAGDEPVLTGLSESEVIAYFERRNPKSRPKMDGHRGSEEKANPN